MIGKNKLWNLRFGLAGGEEKTQKDVADMLRNFTILYFSIRKENY